MFAVKSICLIKNLSMRYNTIVEKDETNILKLISAAEQFSEERFLEGIKLKRYSLYDIQQTTIWVRERQQILNREYLALMKFSETFIKSYATDNNKCFDSAYRLFNKIRSTISATSKVFRKMCPEIHRQQPKGAEKPLAIERSIFSHAHYTPDLFGLESFDKSVEELFNDLETFFTSVISTLLLCREMINKEREVRMDSKLCLSIYRECCEESMNSIKSLVGMFDNTHLLPKSELQERKDKARQLTDFVCDNYHKHDKSTFKTFILVDAVKKGRNDGLTDLETTLWPNNHTKALTVRDVVKNFDNLPRVEGKRNKLCSRIIVEFIKWCDVDKSKEKTLYNNYFKDNYTGKYETLGWTAISNERKNMTDTKISDKELADSFQKALQSINTSADDAKSNKAAGF